jgi:hypothetical protein
MPHPMAKQEFPPLFPRGFHPMTLDEMRKALVDNIAGSKRRKPIMEGLVKLIEKLRADGIAAEIWVNGSFLTKKIDPDDSDILVLVPGDFLDNATPEQKATLDWLNTDLKASHMCHSFVLTKRPEGHPEHEEFIWDHAYWLRQFGFSRKDDPKGLVTIKTP